MKNEQQFFDDETANIYDIWLILQKRFLVIISIFFLFNVGVYAYLYFTPKVYKCSNILISSLPQSKIINESFDPREIYSLIRQFTARSKNENAMVIGLTPPEAIMINSISITKVTDGDMLKIEVDTIDREKGKKAIQLIKEYINAMPYVKRRTDQIRSLYTQNMQEIQLVLDNPSRYMASLKGEGLMFSNFITSLFELQQKYNEMSIAMEALSSSGLIILADESYLPEEPYRPSKTKLIVFGIVGGCFAGAVIALLFEWFARSKREYLSESRNATH